MRGTCLAFGYYKNPEKTREAFMQNPLNDAYPEMIYRTGDLATINEHGEMVFACRKDFRIKHRGIRIELGEIETALSSVDNIGAVCCLHDGDKDCIIAIWDGPAEWEDIHQHVKKLLPEYMLPERGIHLDAMPYNLNGKIDRNKLKDYLTVKQDADMDSAEKGI